MEQLINVINNRWFFGSIIGLFVLYVVGLSVVLAIWTWRDVRDRTNSAAARFLAPLAVLLFGFAGFVPYLVLRPRMTFAERIEERRDVLLLAEAAKKFECPTCFAAVERDFAFCPSCKVEFRPVCQCGATLDQTWTRCAYCGTPVSAELRTRKYATPLPAVDLPPAVEPVAKASPKAPSVKPKKLRANSEATKVVIKNKLPEVTIAKPSGVAAPISKEKAAKPARIGLTGRFRRALAIKR